MCSLSSLVKVGAFLCQEDGEEEDEEDDEESDKLPGAPASGGGRGGLGSGSDDSKLRFSSPLGFSRVSLRTPK